jgi:SAM-dependent methyltransferase
LKDFNTPLAPSLLNIEDKSRSNLFAWRGQFSPQLIEYLLDAYCIPGSTVLDPFAGSGTVLYESAAKNLPAYGYEINPAAWCFCKLYEFTNMREEERRKVLNELRERIYEDFPIVLFSENVLEVDAVERRIINIGNAITNEAKILCNALVVLLDVYNNPVANGFVQKQFALLTELVMGLPFSDRPIKADLQDARALPLGDQSVDFSITSPPYINVFNYHQNYRRSAEILGWDLLRVARSEIGSNRANRGNRFLTVIQYCVDLTKAIQEAARVLITGGRAVYIVGHESNVLGAPFYNAWILDQLAQQSGMFEVVLSQKRVFVNRFGRTIREDILNLSKLGYINDKTIPVAVGRAVARSALTKALSVVPEKNAALLREAIHRVDEIGGTSLFDSSQYEHYQTRDRVMMVKEGGP